MSLLTAELQRFLDDQVVGALATRSSQGSVHQSLVYYARQGDELLISTLSKRRKALDVEESGCASLCVMGHARPFPSLTVSGTATLRRSDIGLATATIAQRMLGLEEPPEPQTDVALGEADRVILVLQVGHVGPVSHIDSS